MAEVFISTYPFGLYDASPLKILEAAGINYQRNPFKRKLTPEELCDYALDFKYLIAGTENLKPLINKSSKLKLISRVGIGLDSVPLKLCKEKGIKVSYTPDAVTMAVSELTLGLMISISRFVHRSNLDLRNSEWNRYVGKRIQESVIGIIGLGRVGKKVVELLSSFKPKKILFNDIQNKVEESKILSKNTGIPIVSASKEETYSSSDIISLHLPYTHKTENMINSNSLELFSKDSFLINTSRGHLISEDCLFRALKENRIRGAALDVYKTEPYTGKLSTLSNIVLTAHMGSCSYDCRLAMEYQAAEEVINYIKNNELLREVPLEEYSYQEPNF